MLDGSDAEEVKSSSTGKPVVPLRRSERIRKLVPSRREDIDHCSVHPSEPVSGNQCAGCYEAIALESQAARLNSHFLRTEKERRQHNAVVAIAPYINLNDPRQLAFFMNGLATLDCLL
jgi:hypothetical protein